MYTTAHYIFGTVVMVAIILWQQVTIRKRNSRIKALKIDLEVERDKTQHFIDRFRDAYRQSESLSDRCLDLGRAVSYQSDEIQKLRIECQVHLKNVQRFTGSWAEPTKQNTTYASVFKRAGGVFPIHETVKILHDFGVTFDGIGLIQFKDLMVLLK